MAGVDDKSVETVDGNGSSRTEEPEPGEPEGRRLGGRGGSDDQPAPTGGDGFQTEPPAVRD
jgi:hypothetical protein